jgi:plastocyanin
MRRLAFAAALLAAGCNPSKPPAAPAKEEPVAYFQPDPATAAQVRGKARFEGKAPAAKRIAMDSDEDCRKLHKAPVFEDRVVAAKDGGLLNVLVYVKTGLEGKRFAPPSEAVKLEQTGCRFAPRVVALRTGQTLAVKNNDPVSHNVHPTPQNNRDWNQQQAPGAPDIERRFGFAEVAIPIKCNVHAWMRAYAGVFEHPYYAVTGRDGTFTLSGLPPGRYTLAAWHEAFGESVLEVTVGAGETGAADFLFR